MISKQFIKPGMMFLGNFGNLGLMIDLVLHVNSDQLIWLRCSQYNNRYINDSNITIVTMPSYLDPGWDNVTFENIKNKYWTRIA